MQQVEHAAKLFPSLSFTNTQRLRRNQCRITAKLNKAKLVPGPIFSTVRAFNQISWAFYIIRLFADLYTYILFNFPVQTGIMSQIWNALSRIHMKCLAHWWIDSRQRMNPVCITKSHETDSIHSLWISQNISLYNSTVYSRKGAPPQATLSIILATNWTRKPTHENKNTY